jgi:hypothetical protein
VQSGWRAPLTETHRTATLVDLLGRGKIGVVNCDAVRQAHGPLSGPKSVLLVFDFTIHSGQAYCISFIMMVQSRNTADGCFHTSTVPAPLSVAPKMVSASLSPFLA